MVGAEGFEPPTPCSQSRCANRTALRPDPMRTDRVAHSRGDGRPDSATVDDRGGATVPRGPRRGSAPRSSRHPEVRFLASDPLADLAGAGRVEDVGIEVHDLAYALDAAVAHHLA